MTRGLRRLRNLNLDEHGAEPVQEGHENIADNGNNGNRQGPPDIDGLLARLPHQPRSPIKIICKFHVLSLHIQIQCEILEFPICKAKWRG